MASLPSLPETGSDSLLNARQVADRLGVSERWVRDHATRRTPRIPVVKLGPLVRFLRADIEDFIGDQREDHSGTRRRK
jgi:predicted DNA-binding transcriptional regulator AlpA